MSKIMNYQTSLILYFAKNRSPHGRCNMLLQPAEDSDISCKDLH